MNDVPKCYQNLLTEVELDALLENLLLKSMEIIYHLSFILTAVTCLSKMTSSDVVSW